MHPTTIEADVMKPLPVDGLFDSAALNYVLHCLRGPQSQKAVAIRNVAAVLEPDGVLFGGTVLGTGGRHTLQARAVLWAFNRKGDFDNLGDTADGLREILEESFQTVEVDVIGSVAHSRPPAHSGPGNGNAPQPARRGATRSKEPRPTGHALFPVRGLLGR